MSGPSSPAAGYNLNGNERLNVEGDDGSIRWTFKNDSCIVRVDVPGCSGVPMSYNLHPDHVVFEVEEPAMDHTDRSRRKYNGYVKFDPVLFDAANAKVNVLRGVLWITVPRKH
ncbi:unnamed protein product [Arabis nemorensis]|uniref:SHSP domain-containing protein n=1 Tax=Arabis nemorensis TaxID=586526 RepID=A0A565ANN7_9BRAS|nr:unnamed protein product [Arabis nemorensis]